MSHLRHVDAGTVGSMLQTELAFFVTFHTAPVRNLKKNATIEQPPLLRPNF